MFNHIPLLITIYLENNFCKLSEMPLDSILAKLYFQQQINENIFDGNYYQELEFLKKSDGVYHTSKPFYKILHISNDSIIKNFTIPLFVQLDGNHEYEKRVSNRRSDRYKKHIQNFELIYTEKIQYYACGDFDIIKTLLSNLNYIGKKASLGWGKILKIEIEEIENDYSLFKHNKAMRHLPNIKKYQNATMYAANIPLTPPYWKQTNDLALVQIDE